MRARVLQEERVLTALQLTVRRPEASLIILLRHHVAVIQLLAEVQNRTVHQAGHTAHRPVLTVHRVTVLRPEVTVHLRVAAAVVAVQPVLLQEVRDNHTDFNNQA